MEEEFFIANALCSCHFFLPPACTVRDTSKLPRPTFTRDVRQQYKLFDEETGEGGESCQVQTWKRFSSLRVSTMRDENRLQDFSSGVYVSLMLDTG